MLVQKEREPYVLVELSCANKRNKSMRTFFFGQTVVHKRKNKQKGPYAPVICSCGISKNGSMRTLIFGRTIVHNKME